MDIINTRGMTLVYHFMVSFMLAPVGVLSCNSDEAPLQSTTDESDFLYSITNSTVKGKHARYGTGKSAKVYPGQVFEMTRYEDSWLFTLYTLSFEVKGATKVKVMLIKSSGDVTTLQEMTPADPSVFEAFTVDSMSSPVIGLAKLQIGFEAAGDFVNIQQLVTEACGGCPLGYDTLLSSYDSTDFEPVITNSAEDAKLAFTGSGSFVNVSATSTLQITTGDSAEEPTFLLLYVGVNVTGAYIVKFAHKAAGNVAVHYYQDVLDPTGWTEMEMTLGEAGIANVTRVMITAIPTSGGLAATALLSGVFVLACRESIIPLITEAVSSPLTCYAAGASQNDFTLSFENPSSTLVKPSNPDGILEGSGIQIWVYDYTLIVRLPSGDPFDLVELTLTAYFLQTGTYYAYDNSNALIHTGTLVDAGGNVYKTDTPIDGVVEIRVDFVNTADFNTVFVFDLIIDACPEIQATTEPPTTEPPTTEPPTTEQPTTEQPTAEKPTTIQPTTEKPTTELPTTEPPTTTFTTEAYYSTSPQPDYCPDGSAVLYAKHVDVDFDIYLDDNEDLGLNPLIPLEGSEAVLILTQNNTYHVNRSIIGVPYQLMEVRFDIRGATQVLSGALDYIGYISQVVTIADSSGWTSVNLTIQDGGFVDIFEVTLEWFGDADIELKNLYVLACKSV